MDENNLILEFRVQHPDEVLLWLTFICALGAISTSWQMSRMSNFFFYKRLQPDGNMDKEENLWQQFSIMQLEFPRSKKSISEIITGMTTQVKETVRMQLRIDYYFMPFAYLFLLFGASFVLWRLKLDGYSISGLKPLLIFPFLCWALDIAENKLIASALTNPARPRSTLIYAIAFTKWAVTSVFLLLALTGLIISLTG